MTDSHAKHHVAFFRQSGWLTIAAVLSGGLMWGVHFLSKKIPASEYGVLVSLLSLTMCLPSGPLQAVFAHQSAADLALDRRRQLAGKIHFVCIGLFLLWLVAAAGMLLAQNTILARWQIANPAALWVTIGVILFYLWAPMFAGLLQGKQDFLWLGWSSILNGVGRLGIAACLVLALGAWATGIMIGIFTGYVVATAVAAWFSRDLWAVRAEPFDRRALLSEAVPLMFGFGAAQVLFTADTMFVNSFFSSTQTAYYGAAGTLSRALVWVIGPLTTVMFPKIVHSTARSEKINLLTITLLSTLLLAGGGAVGLCLLGPWVVKIVYPVDYVAEATRLLPWYAGAMLPISIAMVLVNNLLARSRFRVVPWLVVLAVIYCVTMTLALRAQLGTQPGVIPASPASTQTTVSTPSPSGPPPVVVVQPKSQIIFPGSNATFTVVANGSAPLGYQWTFCGTNLPGQTGSTLTLTAPTTNQAGPYSVTVTNAGGTTTSSTATLTVNQGNLVRVLQLLAGFNLVLLGVCAWFTWGSKADQKAPATP